MKPRSCTSLIDAPEVTVGLVINQQIPGTHSKFITTGISNATLCNNVLYSVCFVYAGFLVWNIWTIFPYIGNVIIPTDGLIFFRGVGIPPASNYIGMIMGDDD